MVASRASRHGFVDALRGFALFGILVVNIEFIVAPAETGWGASTTGLDGVVRWLVIALGQTKIYPIFALLFGYGLALQLTNAGDDTVLAPRYRRRMIGLVLLGVAHGVLFFPGDILVIYAVVGATLFRLRNTPTERLLKIAAWVYGAAAACWLVLGALLALGAEPVPGEAPPEAIDILSNGTFVEVAILHAFYWVVTLGILSLIQGPAVVACFCAGVALGRSTLLAEPDAHRDVAVRVLRWFPLGLAGAAAGATLTLLGGRWDTLGFAIGFAAAPFVAAGYLAALALWMDHRSGKVSALLQSAGRMSLSVYLLESIVVSTLSYGYGFGLFLDVGPAAGVALAVAIFIGLCAGAVIWMRFARFGPFEWLLRSFTYRAVQPVRRLTRSG